MDPLILKAYKSTQLSASELPPLADVDWNKNLIRKSYPALDPFSGAPRTNNLIWGLAKVFRSNFIMQFFVIVCDVRVHPTNVTFRLMFLG
jgi:hypothetical protein